MPLNAPAPRSPFSVIRPGNHVERFDDFTAARQCAESEPPAALLARHGDDCREAVWLGPDRGWVKDLVRRTRVRDLPRHLGVLAQ
jgi:hypothetical protein